MNEIYGVLSKNRWFLYKGTDKQKALEVYQKEKDSDLLIEIIEEKKELEHD